MKEFAEKLLNESIIDKGGYKKSTTNHMLHEDFASDVSINFVSIMKTNIAAAPKLGSIIAENIIQFKKKHYVGYPIIPIPNTNIVSIGKNLVIIISEETESGADLLVAVKTQLRAPVKILSEAAIGTVFIFNPYIGYERVLDLKVLRKEFVKRHQCTLIHKMMGVIITFNGFGVIETEQATAPVGHVVNVDGDWYIAPDASRYDPMCDGIETINDLKKISIQYHKNVVSQ